MRATLSRYTEWAWARGTLRESDDIARAARDFHVWLERRKAPKSKIVARFVPAWVLEFVTPKVDASRALNEIEQDMWRSLRVLAYGGRGPKMIPERRKEILEAQARDNGWSVAA